MNDTERHYLYKPRWRTLLLGVLLFGPCSVILGNLALSNDRELVIGHIIELSPSGAAIFFQILCAFSIALTACCITFGVYYSMRPRRVVLTAESVTAPKRGLHGEELTVAYREVRDLALVTAGRRTYLQLISPERTLSIMEPLLPSKETFEEVCDLVTERVRNAKTP